jgi:hypothetical protein
MEHQFTRTVDLLPEIMRSIGKVPIFRPGDHIRISGRSSTGHYRMPFYLRGKRGVVEAVIEPAAVDNDEASYGRNARAELHPYRICVPMTEIWPDYIGSPRDGLRVEIVECWLARI